MIRIGIVAGEASGDILGAGLIAAIKKIHPDAVFEGIGGEKMKALGCESLFSLERLSVMGISEPLKRLPEILHMRKALLTHFAKNPVDVFVGIDAPAFNIGLELRLKKAGVKTVHYVSPSVWAWRKNRIHKIGKAVDKMLTLFPFETKIYEDHSVPCCFVGHPLADAISPSVNKVFAKQALGFGEEDTVVAIMPGSRSSELALLAEPFFKAAKLCHAQNSSIRFVAPVINEAHRVLIEKCQQNSAPDLPVKFLVGKSREAMAAADCALLASGTATLEAMLLKCPMVVAYRMSALTFAVAKRLVKTPFIALPNILAGRKLVPEFIQDEVSPESLSSSVLALINESSSTLLDEFDRLHAMLAQSASERAALEVLK